MRDSDSRSAVRSLEREVPGLRPGATKRNVLLVLVYGLGAIAASNLLMAVESALPVLTTFSRR